MTDRQCDRCGEVDPAEIHTCTPKEQEPVATVYDAYDTREIDWHCDALPTGTKLYAAPPRREWQGLTDEDMTKLRHLVDWTVPLDIKKFARAIEAKLKEKNA